MTKTCRHCKNPATQERRNKNNTAWIPLCDNLDCYIREVYPERFEVPEIIWAMYSSHNVESDAWNAANVAAERPQNHEKRFRVVKLGRQFWVQWAYVD